VPTGRSLATAALIVVAAGAAWLAARETPVFSVRTIEVAGAPAGVTTQVRRSLATTEGTSLLKVDLDAALGNVTALPTVASARFDRAFPHTLRVVVVPEHAVAVVRQGAKSYIVAESGRIMATSDRHARPALARIWVKRDVQLGVGATAEGDLLTAVAAVAPLVGSGFPGRVSSVTVTPTNLSLTLRSGLELRLGDPQDVALKLAVAARVIPLLTSDTTYLDVAVPERPVSGTLYSQVEPESSTSTQP
jgi:cell division protein FtsQ